MRLAYRINIGTHSEYVIRIAIQLQQWLNERASVVRYMYIGWLAGWLFPSSFTSTKRSPFVLQSYHSPIYSRDIRRLWNPNVHYRADSSSVLVDVVSHMDRNHTLLLCVFLRSILTLFAHLHQAYKGTRIIMFQHSLLYPFVLAVSSLSVNHLYHLL
jgi:hypothetical protein